MLIFPFLLFEVVSPGSPAIVTQSQILNNSGFHECRDQDRHHCYGQVQELVCQECTLVVTLSSINDHVLDSLPIRCRMGLCLWLAAPLSWPLCPL